MNISVQIILKQLCGIVTWNDFVKRQGNDKYFESVIYSLYHWFKISITLPLTSADILKRYQKEKKTKKQPNPVQFAVKYIKANY